MSSLLCPLNSTGKMGLGMWAGLGGFCKPGGSKWVLAPSLLCGLSGEGHMGLSSSGRRQERRKGMCEPSLRGKFGFQRSFCSRIETYIWGMKGLPRPSTTLMRRPVAMFYCGAMFGHQRKCSLLYLSELLTCCTRGSYACTRGLSTKHLRCPLGPTTLACGKPTTTHFICVSAGCRLHSDVTRQGKPQCPRASCTEWWVEGAQTSVTSCC